MRAVKIVIAGAFNAGKSQMIVSASEIDPVRTERRVSDHTSALKDTTTAAMDYGRLTLPGAVVLHLYGTPGQRRFDFMWQALARGMRGLLLVVDSADPASFADARGVLEFFARLRPTPLVVVANKQDRPGALAPADLAAALDLLPEVPVVPCVATDPASARAALETLLTHIPIPDVPDVSAAAAPIAPRPPARLAAVAWPGSREHLTIGGGRTLCGRGLPAGALPIFVAGAAGCLVCAGAAARAGLTCADCGRPLTRSADGVRCLGCAQRRRTAPRDSMAPEVELPS